jgi:hypothetical protein
MRSHEEKHLASRTDGDDRCFRHARSLVLWASLGCLPLGCGSAGGAGTDGSPGTGGQTATGGHAGTAGGTGTGGNDAGTLGGGAAAGTLVLSIGGTTQGTTYDSLVVTGQARLAGQLVIKFVNGFTPIAGQRFVLVTAGKGILGSFGLIDSGGVGIVPGQDANTFYITIAP